ncbi:MAG TPA: hypothetical protein VHW09_16925 [Bryobacteraceae bacterium]|jgi:hypothetical protein|nr:hypothetical protein [Bryobacteraceae bacterium]
MPDHTIHKASELNGDERVMVERWLGRTLASDETISVSAYRPHVPPDADLRQTLRRSIVAQAREIGSRAEDISDGEVEQLLDEAFDNIRGRR